MPRKGNYTVPSDEEILGYDNVPVEVACRYIGWSSATLYRALQEQRAPFGVAVKGAGWSYNISPGLLVKYKRGDLPTYRLREVQELMAEGVCRIVDEKLSVLRNALQAVTQ